jgi:hypothetical protein
LEVVLNKFCFTILLVAVLALGITPAVFAQPEPVAGCLDNFELMMVMDHPGDSMGDMHIGTSADQNGDGYVCMQHVADGKFHVHIDNTIPLP